MIDEPIAKAEEQAPPPPQTAAAWQVDIGTGMLAPRSALGVLTSLNERIAAGKIDEFQPLATGFVPLDKTIGGGLRPGELMLIGGAQGTGKTTMALQMARNAAASGQATVLYVCFEHEEEYLIQRMVAMESALSHLPQKSGAVKIQDVKKEVVSSYTASAETGTRAKLGANPRLRPSLERIARYGSNLYLMRGTATKSTIDNMRDLVGEHKASDDERRLVLFVDYLQKVPVIPEPNTEEEKVTRIVSGLKDIALAVIGQNAMLRNDGHGRFGDATSTPSSKRCTNPSTSWSCGSPGLIAATGGRTPFASCATPMPPGPKAVPSTSPSAAGTTPTAMPATSRCGTPRVGTAPARSATGSGRRTPGTVSPPKPGPGSFRSPSRS